MIPVSKSILYLGALFSTPLLFFWLSLLKLGTLTTRPSTIHSYSVSVSSFLPIPFFHAPPTTTPAMPQTLQVHLSPEEEEKLGQKKGHFVIKGSVKLSLKNFLRTSLRVNKYVEKLWSLMSTAIPALGAPFWSCLGYTRLKSKETNETRAAINLS